jgi:hypothetical protein
MRNNAILLVLLSSLAGARGGVLESWSGSWSPYRLIDEQGRNRRLLKASVQFTVPAPSGAHFTLRAPDGAVLDTEQIPPGKRGMWAHGFWMPSSGAASRFTLDLVSANRVIESRAVEIAAGGEPVSLPLRIDRLNRSLLDRLTARESVAVPPGNADVAAYLRQHDIVYQQPSSDWVEGLPLGNGDVGALVAGEQGREQVFYLDKTDIWHTAPDGTALGRSWAGTIRIRYRGGAPADFRQRLSLGRAEVETADGAFRSAARVDALRNRLEVDFEAAGAQIEVERQPVTLWVNRRGGYQNAERLFGSWANVMPAGQLEKLRSEAAQAPTTRVEWNTGQDTCSFLQTAPNLRTALSARLTGARIDWKADSGRCVGTISAAPGAKMRLEAAVATSREGRDPAAVARARFGPSGRAAHLEWWRRFWNRSWIDLPDKLEESLWYIGVYQQASCSRSDQAVSFFGLWHPLDHRTWYDAYVADAQVPMIWWQTFASNHLEMLYPSHRTFARMAAEFARNTPGAGMVVPHFSFPDWAGGKPYYTGVNPHKGAAPWFVMNFWWDYWYSGDREFLAEVTYPLLRMTADYLVSDLVKQADGRYHCLNSQSPEQDNTSRDNTFDWGMLTWFFRAAIQASETLNVDANLRAQWRDRLDNLFPPPGDGKTLWEAPNNAHPYRCHPVVFFPLYPTNAIRHGSPLFESARRTMPVVTRLFGFRYEDRHAAIPEFEGGIEPNGFSSGILTVNAARLGDRDLYRRFLYGLIVRFHLKQNGLRALIDTRHSDAISRASLVEAANAHTTAISESLLQSWDDHIRLFPCIAGKGRVRFSGLRAAGGFVISAETVDGKLRWARVTSLHGGPLRIALSKDAPITTLETRVGGVYLLPAGAGRPDLGLPPALPHPAPRSIALEDIDRAAGGMLHYPEDLPYGQLVRDGNLYLGIPAQYGAPAPLASLQLLLNQSESTKWEDRQQAARRLASQGARPEVLAALDRLCADPMNVVAHTAAVSLVHIGSREALDMADNHSRINAVAGLRREVEKARGRLRR